MNPMSTGVFLSRLLPALLELGRYLYERNKGNLAVSRDDLIKIKDYWATVPAERAAIDQELADLKAQGK